MKSVFLENIRIHKQWNSFISPAIKQVISEIEAEITQTDYTPPADKVLRFLEMPLDAVKIIIIGQDPYPQPGVATGRSFEVGTLKSWNDPFKNISLKNILRALYQAYSGKTIKFSELKQKLDNEFPLLPPDKLFSHWESEDVLLLNTSFTCETGKPGSHRKNWENFTRELLHFIAENNQNITWFLWGSHAQEATENLDLQKKIETHHPMMCFDAPGREKDFLFGEINCFSRFIPGIDWTGYKLKKELQTAGELF